MDIKLHLDEQAEKQLAFVQSTTRQSVTDVISQALALYYQQLRNQQGAGTRQLMESDFIGCAEGPEDLSTDYKQYLHVEWDDKHGDR